MLWKACLLEKIDEGLCGCSEPVRLVDGPGDHSLCLCIPECAQLLSKNFPSETG